MRARLSLPGVLLLIALLAGCASAPTGGGSSASPTVTATLAPTVAAMSPTPPITTTDFTCPATVSGAVKVFSDSETGLSFTYPATWTENDCQRTVAKNSDGSIAGQSILVGNLFIVSVAPRRGLTIQQFVANVQGAGEKVTITSLTVAHAVEADTVTTTTAPGSDQPPRFAQTLAIIAGTENFYEVSSLDAVMSSSDTNPNFSRAQLIQQIVATFDVP